MKNYIELVKIWFAWLISLESRYFLVRCLNNKEDNVESYNACNMFLCKFCCTGSYLCLLQTTLLAKALYWEGMLLVHQKPWAKTYAICVHHNYLLCGIFLPFQVNCLCATFKISFLVFAIHSSWENSLKTIVVLNMLLMYLISYKLLVER